MTVSCNQPIGDPKTFNNAFISKNAFASDADAEQFLNDNGLLLVAGDRYYNNVTNELRFYDGTQWLSLTDGLLTDTALIGNPTAPTQQSTDDSTKIATTEFVKNVGFGHVQAWQNLTGSRSSGVTYTNPEAYTIVINVQQNITTGSQTMNMNVNGFIVDAVSDQGSHNKRTSLFAVVPPGGTYRVTINSGSVFRWFEFR